MRICSKCKAEKDITEFYKQNKSGTIRCAWCKKCVCEFQKQRWKDRKIKAIDLLGGACSNCGYVKNFAALDFHHVDPSKKDANWNRICKRSWSRILEELKKCILLCRNCHSEYHYPHWSNEDEKIGQGSHARSQDEKDIRIRELKSTGVCPICSSLCFGTKYCCNKCCSKDQRRVQRPVKSRLMKELKEYSWVALGRKYGVSDNAVRKWARLYGLLKA